MNPPNTKDPTRQLTATKGRLEHWPVTPNGETVLFNRLHSLCEEGLAISNRIAAARKEDWHSFVPADYDNVLRALLRIREHGGRFLEMGSATGVIAIMADLLGFEACGIEIAPELVTEARGLAERYQSNVRFATGSFIPAGYRWESATGDTRLGSLGIDEPAYAELGYELGDFDWVYAYPWPGETEVLGDLMRKFGAPQAKLLIRGYTGGLEFYPPL